MYGPPKIHKANTALRPIMSMVKSPSHELAKWLASILKRVEQVVCRFTVKDSFEFVQRLSAKALSETSYMCSFDVISLFTNVPIGKCIAVLRGALTQHDIDIGVDVDVFVRLHIAVY